MIRIIFCTLLSLTLPMWAAAQRTVLESERMRFEAQIAQDTAALAHLLADELVYIHSNALVESKSDFIRSVSGGGIRYLGLQKSLPGSIQMWGKTAVSQGIVEVKGLYQGSTFDMTLHFTSIYRKEKGKWRLFAWQSTRIP